MPYHWDWVKCRTSVQIMRIYIEMFVMEWHHIRSKQDYRLRLYKAHQVKFLLLHVKNLLWKLWLGWIWGFMIFPSFTWVVIFKRRFLTWKSENLTWCSFYKYVTQHLNNSNIKKNLLKSDEVFVQVRHFCPYQQY